MGRLCLSRKSGESLDVLRDGLLLLRLRIVSVGRGGAKLAIEAPRELRILRSELIPPAEEVRKSA